jgi:DNA-binding FadR family transcriptional regulator
MERLMQAIKLGTIPQGGRLPSERELAARLGVSRSTVREVIRALKEIGFVEVRLGRGGGTFASYSASAVPEVEARKVAAEMGDEFLDILDFRLVVEPAAAERAAQRASREDVAQLRAMIQDLNHTDLAEYRSRDSRFHLAIAEISSSQLLASAIADTQLRLTNVVIALPLWEEPLKHSDEQHEQLVDAIGRGAPQRARDVMFEHVSGTAALLRELCGDPEESDQAEGSSAETDRGRVHRVDGSRATQEEGETK